MKIAAILVARLIFAFVFGMAASFKFVFIGMDPTAAQIAGAGFPFPLLLAWVAAFFEAALAIAFLTGLFFSEAAVVAIAYVLFLAFSFHGPDRWKANPMGSDSSSTISPSSRDSCSQPSMGPDRD